MLNIPKEVKDLFKKDSVRKNIRIHFPNGERADITNSNLIAESFSFTESVMSQSEFRFGLCEASMVEFECFGVENIKGYEIEVSHEIDISSLGEDFIAEYGMTSDDVAFPFYRVPYGKFTVDEAIRQSDMVRRKVTAYGRMVESFEPNKFDLTKENSVYNQSGEYKIDLIKYLYSKVPFNGEIPNSTLTDKSRADTFSTFFLYGDFLLTVAYIVDEDSIGTQNLFKITLGERLLTPEEIYNSIREYIESLGIYPSDLIEDALADVWDESISKSLIDFFAVGGNICEINKDSYIYGGIPCRIGIPVSVSLQDSNGKIVKEMIIRNADTFKIERVNINYPQIYFSHPLKKASDGKYYLKDIPYDEIFLNIEEALELHGKFGKVDRCGNFQMFSVNNNFGLVPSKTLVPSKALVPRSLKGEILKKGNYSSLWYDDFKTKPYDRVSVSYKNANEEEVYAEHLIVDVESDTYNASDYQAYSLTENTLIQNGIFTEAQIMEILQTVANSLIGLQYMPFEMDSIGLPYLESGDAVLVETKDGSFQTLVLDRRIDGIQSLADNLNAN